MYKPLRINIFIIFVLAVLFVSLKTEAAKAVSARQLMHDVIYRDNGDTMMANVSIVITDKMGYKKIRKVKVYSKDRGEDVHKILYLSEPKSIKGIVILINDYGGDKKDVQWLYLPETKNVRRIDSSDVKTSFVGSDFTFGDTTTWVMEHWNFKLLGEEKINGKKVYIIEAIPINNTLVDYYGYTKCLHYVRPDINLIVKSVRWIKEGKKQICVDVKGIEQIDGVWTKTRVEGKVMKNSRIIRQSDLIFSNVRYNQHIDDAIFNLENLRKGDTGGFNRD